MQRRRNFKGFRRVAASLAVVLGMFAAVLAPTAPAYANTVRPNSDYYHHVSWLTFPELNMCIKADFTGYINYNARRYGPTTDNWIDYRIDTIQVTTPKMTMTGYAYDWVIHGCTTRTRSWSKLSVMHAYKGYGCNYNPQISVAYPFSVGVGFWPSCGNLSVGHWSSTYGQQYTWTQYNSSAKVYFAQQRWFQNAALPTPKPACYGVMGRFHLYVPGVDDVKDTGQMSLCLTPQW